MSLSDHFAGWRNRLISSPDFQAWAVRNPLTRPIAQRKAREAFDLVAGFVYSQVLAAAVECRLIEMAGTAPVREADFADTNNLPLEGARRLLKAAEALKLVRQEPDGRYGLGEQGAALLGNPSVFAMIRHHRTFYRDLESPLDLLRERTQETGLGRFWDYSANAREGNAQSYSQLMSATQALIARNVLEAYEFGRHRTVMDVGGGQGTFLSAVGAAHPGLELVLVDLPAVAGLAERRPGLQLRIEPRDMLREPLPEGADLITLIRVVHDHDDRPVRLLLSSIRRALAPGGRLLIAEPMAGVKGAGAMADAYFGMYLWVMGRGRPRSANELTGFLKEAGFRQVRRLKTAEPLLVSALVAG